MNIALVNSEYPSRSGQDHGGIASYVYTMACALSKAGNTVHVLIRPGVITEGLGKEVQVHSFDFVPVRTGVSFFQRTLNKNIYWEYGCSQGAREVIAKIHTDQPLHVVEIPEYNGIASRFFRSVPYAVVVNFHTPTQLVDMLNDKKITLPRKKVYTYEKKALQNAYGFRCPSITLKNEITQLYRINPEEVTVIRNPLDTGCFDSIPKKTFGENNRIEILFAGRLERRKGIEIIHERINDILSIDQRIHVTFAGETRIDESMEYRQRIEHRVQKEYRDRLWFCGPVTRNQLYMLYRTSDIFLMPSLFENAPYSLLEAMAAQCPVIGADTGGIREIISHGDNGLLFSLSDTRQLCSCINELIRSSYLRQSLVQHAYEYIKVFHDPVTLAQQTIDFYRSIIHRRDQL